MRQSLPANHYDGNHRLLRKAFTVKGLTPSTDFGCARNVLSFHPFFSAPHISVISRSARATSVHTTLVTVARGGTTTRVGWRLVATSAAAPPTRLNAV